jgi:hypothetical protein
MFAFAANTLSADEIASFCLIKDAKVACQIVVSDDAKPPVKRGARELSEYLSKISSSAAPEISTKPSKKLHNIYVCEVSDQKTAAAAGITKADITRFDDYLYDDGYAIVSSSNGLYIVGANDRGALSGCYDVLKRYAGVRWLFPGADGEYWAHRPTIVVPQVRIIEKPEMRLRYATIYGEDTLLWQARNRMQNSAFPGGLMYNPKRPDLDSRANLFRSLGCRGKGIAGHVMSALMFGKNWGTTKPERLEFAKRFFEKHPEWFPLVDGKRFIGSVSNESSPNPCLSNPALLEHMASNLISKISGEFGAQTYVMLGNNDTTVWCECDNCRALDCPETIGTKGERSDRYWWVVNELSRRVWKVIPDARIAGWCYQDFWYPPRRVKPDKRLGVMISYNNQCWRHSVTDPKCMANSEMAKIYREWKKLEMPVIFNRDEIACEGSPGSDLLPCESVLRDSIRAYKSIGCAGSSLVIHPPFPEYMAWSKNFPPFYGKAWWWHSMWQCCYIAAELMWNPNADYDSIYEEINSLYYGKGWDGGLREFRKLQEKAFFAADGCIGWGQGAPLGKSLDLPGSEEKLQALLKKALAAAATDPDPRALKHVERFRDIFEMTWIKERKKYLESYREASASQAKEPITVDGVLDEAVWSETQPITEFFVPPWETRKTNIIGRTVARVAYDREHLYISAECFDPEMHKLVATKTDDRRSGYSKLGERVEIFYSHPDMSTKAYHLIINMEGSILDAFRENVGSFDTSFMTKSKWAVKKYPDRWTMEIAVPAKETGMLCYPGATWKFNLGRCRVVPLTNNAKGERATQVSTCANGHMYSPGNFVNLKLLKQK